MIDLQFLNVENERVKKALKKQVDDLSTAEAFKGVNNYIVTDEDGLKVIVKKCIENNLYRVNPFYIVHHLKTDKVSGEIIEELIENHGADINGVLKELIEDFNLFIEDIIRVFGHWEHVGTVINVTVYQKNYYIVVLNDFNEEVL